MAQAFKAVTKIQGGRNKDDGSNETFTFEPGDVVKGLTKDEMKHLWDNGALEAVDVVEVERKEASDGTEGQRQGPAGPAGAGREPKPTP